MIRSGSTSPKFFKELYNMKKILALAIGLGLVLGTVSFAQDTKKEESKTSKKKGGKKKADKDEKGDKKM
jgi:hypothetical protein